MKIILFLITFIFTFLENNGYYQQEKINTHIFQESNNTNAIVKLKENKKSVGKFQSPEENTRMSVIVEMIDPPMFKLRKDLKKGTNISAANYEETFTRFLNDLDLIKSNSLSKSNNQVNYKIRRKFYKIFNGISIDIDKSLLNEIHKLPYIKQIHFNTEVFALLDESVKIVKADQVWQNYGAEGEGVIIGVLDTGIDYNHPAFGGGIGPGHKIIGGYDFVNNDNDPMDDHECLHGSHVAGIIAADYSHLKGVAPKSNLLVYKVLDANGRGYADDIIAAITMCTDPNGDGVTDDKVDIVNLSLGGRGSIEDAQCTAVNNASELGIVFCIAAGNEGDKVTNSIFNLKNYEDKVNYYSITSPALAERAITVGGIGKDLSIYGGSSRGPASVSFSLKPEIVAPGKNINSVGKNGSVAPLTGTSQAAPHVAGICALIKETHPDWSAEDIKSAVINNAVDLGFDNFTQGTGLVDAVKSIGTKTTVYPNTVNFGNAAINEHDYQKEEIIVITNLSEQIQEYIIELESLPPGVLITASEYNISILPNSTKQITIDLYLSKQSISETENESFTYSNFINLTSNIDSLRIPWSVANVESIKLSYDDSFCYIYVFNDEVCLTNPQNLSSSSNPFETELFLPSGSYGVLFDFYACSDEIHRWVLNENISTAGSDKLNVESVTGDQYLVEMSGVDQNGNRLSEMKNYNAVYTLIFPKSSSVDYIFFQSPKPLMKMSNFSEGFKLLTSEFVVDFTLPGSVYEIQYDLKSGLNNNYSFTNSPEELINYGLNIYLPDYINKKGLAFYNYYSYPSGGGAYGFIDSVSNDYWYGNLYLTEAKQRDYLFNISFNLIDLENSQYGQFYESPNSILLNENLTFSNDFLINDKLPISLFAASPGDQFKIGTGPVYFNGFTHHDDFMNTRLYGSIKEWRRYEQNNSHFYIIDNSYNIISEGSFKNINAIGSLPDNPKIIYSNNKVLYEKLFMNSSYTVLKSPIDVAPYLPQLVMLQVRDQNSIPVGRIEINKKANCYFVIRRISEIDKLKTENIVLKARRIGEYEWQNIPLISTYDSEYLEMIFEGDLSIFTDTDSSAIELKISYFENDQEILKWRIKPSLIIGNYPVYNEQNSLVVASISQVNTHNNVVKVIDIPAYDPTGREIKYEAVSENENVIVKIIEDQLFIIPQNNWIGECRINLIVSNENQSFEQKIDLIVSESISSTKGEEIIPDQFTLYNNYPNPFNPVTTIIYSLPKQSKVKLDIHDILGNKISTLVNKEMPAGKFQILFDGSNLASGIYFYTLRAGEFIQTKKFNLIK